MPTTYQFGNKRDVRYRSVECYSSLGLEFYFNSDEDFDYFDKNIDKGLLCTVRNDGIEQVIKFERDQFNVIPNYNHRSSTLRVLCPMMKSQVVRIHAGMFSHACQDSARELAHSLSKTILHQRGLNYTQRKRLAVYSKSPVKDFAHIILANLGFGRIRSGMTDQEFYREFTPELAEEELRRRLNHADVVVLFQELEGKREPYRSLFGENIIEFAEQA